jgi:spermidine synthase
VSNTSVPTNDQPLGTVRIWLVLTVAFFSGMSVLAVEISAARLLAPFFGTSIIIWAVVIGLTLLYLSIGYWVGGRLADRRPYEDTLFHIVGIAAFLVGLVPFFSKPVLSVSSQAIASLNGGLFFGSLVGVLLLLAVPLTMLGMVSPFTIRLVTSNVQQAGKRAGQVFAVSTIGSILGAFIPVLLLIPTVGTRSTFLIFAVLLLGLSVIATSRRLRRLLYVLLMAVLIVLWVAVDPGPVRPADGLVVEGESALQFFQVIDSPNVGRRLVLNEGIGTHSIYHPDRLLTNGPWDYFLLAPLIGGQQPDDVDSLLIIGLGGGTVSKQYTQIFGDDVDIDGVEIDDRVIDLGRKYFDMNEPNLKTYAEDGRTFLQRVDRRYDVIAVDAYRQPYIPFHLVTQEFFIAARDHLNDNGVVALNAGRTATDFRLVDVLSETMRSVFPHVYVIDLPSGFNNSLVYGSLRPVTGAEIRAGAQFDPWLSQVADRPWELREVNRAENVYTDDLAPVERLIDDIVVREALHGATGRDR